MQFVQGGSLQSFLRTRLSPTFLFSAQLARSWMRWLLDALVYLHSRDIAHLDVKPDNILLQTTGFLVLADFGLARNLKERPARRCIGTASYSPPELLANQPDSVTTAADIWGAGLCLLTVLSRYPYQHAPGYLLAPETISHYRNQIANTSIELHCPFFHFPDYLLGLVGKMLCHNPRNRPSAALILETIEHGDPVSVITALRAEVHSLRSERERLLHAIAGKMASSSSSFLHGNDEKNKEGEVKVLGTPFSLHQAARQILSEVIDFHNRVKADDMKVIEELKESLEKEKLASNARANPATKSRLRCEVEDLAFEFEIEEHKVKRYDAERKLVTMRDQLEAVERMRDREEKRADGAIEKLNRMRQKMAASCSGVAEPAALKRKLACAHRLLDSNQLTTANHVLVTRIYYSLLIIFEMMRLCFGFTFDLI